MSLFALRSGSLAYVSAGKLEVSADTYPVSALPGFQWGIRRQVPAYGTGAALQLRRGSDNATQVFSFLPNGTVDAAAIAAWLNGATGYVTTLYDQSGRGKHLTQTTANQQPTWYSADADGNPALLFTGVQSLTCPRLWVSTSPRSLVALYRNLATGTFASSVAGQIGLTSDATCFKIQARSAGNAPGSPFLLLYNGDLTNGVSAGTDKVLATATYDGTQVVLRRNGTNIATSTRVLKTDNVFALGNVDNTLANNSLFLLYGASAADTYDAAAIAPLESAAQL